jgi:hypothetical protein
MNTLIPNRFLFDFEFPLAFRRRMPGIDGDLSGWSDAERLPRLGEIDGRTDFADVWACWNETGLAVACRVLGKRKPLRCDPTNFRAGDNLRLCIDTRDARTNRRATRYCRHFWFMPSGGGASGKDACGGAVKFERAREDAPVVPANTLRVAANVSSSGYTLEAFIPADALHGFDPIEHPRIGFYYMLEDTDHGQQYLTVGDELYWYVDPSTWATAVLAQ